MEASTSWAAFVLPCAARGAATGVAFALALVPLLAMVSALAGGVAWTAPAVAVGVTFAAGLIGGPPCAIVEARARARLAPPLGPSLTCCAIVAVMTVVMVAQGIYLSGALRTGIEGGMAELGRAVEAMRRRDGWIPVSLIGGVALAFGVPVGHVVYMRLGGWVADVQFVVMLALMGCEGVALSLLAGLVDDHSREAALVLGCAGVGLITIGLPTGAILPYALRAADRVAPPPPPQEP